MLELVRGLVIGFSIAAPVGPIGLVGGAFLCYLGARTFLAQPPAGGAAGRDGRGLAGAYLSTLGLTLTNPSTILSFVAIFAGLGLGTSGGAPTGVDFTAAAVLVGGVFLGSALWWLILAGLAGALRTRLTPGAMRWINCLSGVIFLGFGLAVLVAR